MTLADLNVLEPRPARPARATPEDRVPPAERERDQDRDRDRAGDMDLARRCVARDRTAQRQLFERERRRVHATLYRVLGGNVAVDDLIQEAFLEVYRSLANFRGESSLATWIDRCTTHVALKYLRGRRARPTLELVSEPHSGDASAEQRALQREAVRRLYAILDGLDPEKRTAYCLHVVDGRSVADVAASMNTSVMTTKTRVFRARHYVDDRARRDPLLKEYAEVTRDPSWEEEARCDDPST